MFAMDHKKSFLENLRNILVYTFPADGHDPITHRINNETYSTEHLSTADLGGYTLALMSDLPDDDVPDDDDAVKDKTIYIDEQGRYFLRDPDGEFKRGTLDDDIDLANLDSRLEDEALTRAILHVTSQNGHTPQGLQTVTADKAKAEAFIHDPLTIYTSVIGLPNRAQEKEGGHFKQSGMNLLRRFTGYSKNSGWLWNTVGVFFFTVLNLAATPFRFVARLVMLFTEVLPAIALMLVQTKAVSPLWGYLKGQYNQNWKEATFGTWVGRAAGMLGAGLLLAATLPLNAATYMVWFYGRCATSPVQMVRDMWYTGNKTGGFIMGTVLALFTIANIMALYAVLAPLALKFMSLHILPWFASHAPAGAAALFKPIFTTLGPVFSALGKAGMALAANFSLLTHIPSVVAIMAVMPEMVGIGFLAGIVTSIAGPVVDYFATSFVENIWYRKPFGRSVDHGYEWRSGHADNDDAALTGGLGHDFNGDPAISLPHGRPAIRVIEHTQTPPPDSSLASAPPPPYVPVGGLTLFDSNGFDSLPDVPGTAEQQGAGQRLRGIFTDSDADTSSPDSSPFR